MDFGTGMEREKMDTAWWALDCWMAAAFDRPETDTEPEDTQDKDG